MSKDTLAQIRTQGERLFSALQREFYSNLTGLHKKSRIEEIFNSHREFGEPELFESINEQVKAENESETGLKLLRAFLADMFIMSRVSPRIDKILSLEARSVLKIGKKRIPYRSALQKILNEPKKQKRDEILSHRTEVQEKLIPHLLEMRYETAGASENLGYSSYSGLMDYTAGTDITVLSQVAKLFIRDTDYISKEMLEWFFMKHMEFPLKDSTWADVAFMLNSFDLKAAYSENDYTVCAAKVLDDSGLVNSSDVSVDSEKRKGKSFGSYLFPTSPPHEMSVSIFPAGGPYDYEAYLSALGSALSYAFTDRDEDFEYRCLRDPSLTKTFSEVFQNLVYERKWLDRYIDYDQGDDFFKLLFLRRLMYTRLAAGRLLYEGLLYSGESIDSLPDIYKEIMEQALHTRVSGRDFLTPEDIREPMLSVSRFKALLIEPYLSKHLQETYDEQWWRVKDAGTELKNIWSEGGRCRLEEISETSGFDGTAAELRGIFERELG
jgi:hypothetical protein